MNVGRIGGIIPRDSPTRTHHAFGSRHTVLISNIANVVKNVNAPVPHFSAAGIEIPMPVIVQLVACDWLIYCWAKPQVIINR